MMSRLLIALFALLQGTHGVIQPVFQDTADTACIPGSHCTAGITSLMERGLCVNTAAGTQCWDGCNPAHGMEAYGTGLPPTPTAAAAAATSKAIVLMVQQLRTGSLRETCPGDIFTKVQTVCIVGQRCNPPGGTWGRGMCVTIANGTLQSDQCLDMCDTSIPLTTYKTTPGKQAGTIRVVKQVQDGNDPDGLTTCPGWSVWVWLWFPIFLCCILGCCFGMMKAYEYARNLKKQRSYREPINEPYADEQGQGPYVDYQENQPQMDQMDMPPPQTMDGLDDPMPVLEPQAEPLLGGGDMYVAPLEIEKGPEINLFDQPNLMGGLAPLTVAAPAAYPMQASNYMTAYQGQPYQAGPVTTSMQVANPQYGIPQVASRPAYTQAYTGATAMTTQPTYGAYGAYGTTYPGTTSMRIG